MKWIKVKKGSTYKHGYFKFKFPEDHKSIWLWSFPDYYLVNRWYCIIKKGPKEYYLYHVKFDDFHNYYFNQIRICLSLENAKKLASLYYNG